MNLTPEFIFNLYEVMNMNELNKKTLMETELFPFVYDKETYRTYERENVSSLKVIIERILELHHPRNGSLWNKEDVVIVGIEAENFNDGMDSCVWSMNNKETKDLVVCNLLSPEPRHVDVRLRRGLCDDLFLLRNEEVKKEFFKRVRELKAREYSQIITLPHGEPLEVRMDSYVWEIAGDPSPTIYIINIVKNLR